DQLLAWNALLRDGFNAGREAAWWASGETTLARFENPRPGRHSVLLTASLDGRPAGAAGAEADPGEPAEVEISVLPQYRRRGVGRALGMQVGNTEQRLLLDLPVDLQKLRAKHGRARGDRARGDGARGDGARGVEVQSWVGACPEEVLEDWTRLSMQMEADVPMGDLIRPAPRTDLDSLRLDERRMEEQGWLLVRSIAQLHGVGVG